MGSEKPRANSYWDMVDMWGQCSEMLLVVVFSFGTALARWPVRNATVKKCKRLNQTRKGPTVRPTAKALGFFELGWWRLEWGG